MADERTEDAIYAEWQAASGDAKDALYQELIRRLEKHAHAVVQLTLHDTRGDIVNLAVWRALKALPTFRQEAQLATWFHAIVYNLCLNEVRKQDRLAEYGLDDLVETQPEKVATRPFEAVDPAIALDQLTSHLSERDKEFISRKLRGDSMDELAEWYGSSIKAVDQKWRRLQNGISRKLRRRAKGTHGSQAKRSRAHGHEGAPDARLRASRDLLHSR